MKKNVNELKGMILNQEYGFMELDGIIEDSGYYSVLNDGTTKNILNTMAEGFEWVQLLPGSNRLTYGADEKPENLIVTVTVEKLLLGV